MRFLLDVCAASTSMQLMLADMGHDVVSAIVEHSRASDEELLALALQEQRVLVTEDKDFGELVYVRRQPHPCIIRFVDMRLPDKLHAMRDLIEHHSDAMIDGSLIVVTRNRLRIRPGVPPS